MTALELPDHPALNAAMASMTAIEARHKEEWLALFAEDACIEDPIGPSVFDPDGNGHRGQEGISAFYDNVIAQQQVVMELVETFPVPNEVANRVRVHLDFGDNNTMIVDCITTYVIDDTGKITNLRAYWSM